jgi:predicted dehydrogenase
MAESKDLTRREFVADAGKATIGTMVAASAPLVMASGRERHSADKPVSVAIVGFGGMGSENAYALAQSEHISAVCDVDLAYCEHQMQEVLKGRNGKPRAGAAAAEEQFAKAKRYTDFRELLEKEKHVEGVVVATPDHLHGIIAKAAMERGRHVYVQKPLTASVHEARVLREIVLAHPKLVTQMGNQGRSSDDARLIKEWIQAGIIGEVREVHVWTNRPIVYWPQGLPRPTGVALPPASYDFDNLWTYQHVQDVLAGAMGAGGDPPKGLDWTLYLGPVAENVPFHPVYHPFNWRGWLDFGAGALGDMGAHLIDHPFWALELSLPESIEATSTPWGTMPMPPLDPNAPANTPAGRPQRRPVSFPVSTSVHYEFAARGAHPAVKLFWSDGGIYPPRPDQLPDDVALKSEGGVIFIGEQGILLHETYGRNPRLYPQELMAAAAAVPKSIPRIPWSHEQNWAKAIRGQAQASSPIEYASRLTETMLLGIAALRAGQGKKLLYDGERGEFTNAPEANQYLTREYRAGWAI